MNNPNFSFDIWPEDPLSMRIEFSDFRPASDFNTVKIIFDGSITKNITIFLHNDSELIYLKNAIIQAYDEYARKSSKKVKDEKPQD